MTKGIKGFTKGEEFLMNDFNNEISTKSWILFHISAIIMSIIPVWMFERMNWTENYSNIILILLGPLTVCLLNIAYSNFKLKIKYKIAMKRDHTVLKKLSQMKTFQGKKNKKDQTDHLLQKMNESDDYETTFSSIFYNNSLFLGIMVFSNLILFRSLTPLLSLCLSTAGTAGLLALLSTKV